MKAGVQRAEALKAGGLRPGRPEAGDRKGRGGRRPEAGGREFHCRNHWQPLATNQKVAFWGTRFNKGVVDAWPARHLHGRPLIYMVFTWHLHGRPVIYITLALQG